MKILFFSNHKSIPRKGTKFKMSKNAISFSGGGIKAFAHAGAVKAFEEKNIIFDMVSGTSSGSIIAVLYALGYKSKDMYNIMKKYVYKMRYVDKKNIFKIIGGLVFKGRITVDGLSAGNILIKAMKEVGSIAEIKKINQIQMPILIPAVNLNNGEVIVFSSKENRKKLLDGVKYITDVPLEIAVRSSCSFPAVFSPCRYNKMQLVDGGVRENIAWKELKEMGAENVIGINFETEVEPEDYCNNMIEVATRSLTLLERELSNYEIDGIDELITITTKKIGLLDCSKIDYLYEKGYKITKKYIQKYN